MLNYVNNKIPNNLGEILNQKGLTISDAVRISGLTRPTVQKLVDGEDSYLSKMAIFGDSLGLTLSEIYGTNIYHQEQHAHDNSSPTMIGYAFNQAEISHLKQRIKDLEGHLATSEELIKMYKEKCSD